MVCQLLKVLKVVFQTQNKAKEISKKIGFPVLIKAAGGGGGKGNENCS